MSIPLPAGVWSIDPTRSRVAFRVKHMGVATVNGSFGSFAGTLEVTADGASAGGTVRVESIDTGDAHRDSLLRTGDFFDAEAHPEIAFTASSLRAAGRGSLQIDGDLTMRGATRPLTLAATIEREPGADGDGELGLSATGQLSRSDYELRFRGPMAAGNRAVGDKVSISLDLIAVPA